MLYPIIFRTVLVRMDAERAHSLSFSALKALDAVPGARELVRAVFAHGTEDRAEVLGLDFPNRIGLAAGFDKTGTGVRAMAMLGFGHIEVGTVTAHAQPGNPKPRLFRLLDHEAILNRMGFNNPGSRQAAINLRKSRAKVDALPERKRPVIGVNIGKTKIVPAEQAVEDYRTSARVLAPLADYLVINVSSPNTPGLRDLQSTEALRPIITAVREAADAVVENPRSTLGHVPLLVKIAPDLADDDVLAVADLAVELGVDGLITTNTTIDRSVLTGADREKAEAEAGGISGRPLAPRALEVTRLVKNRVGDRLTVIGVGGIDSAEDAQARFDAGADLVQGYSAMIFRGPMWVRTLSAGLRALRMQ
ncbi:quinone-dependent dihydroorotate dehydrogenase [Brevibacterium samyangense]|uniref:Dihydroorotate dehydrogenase (quinone) n=1 Tax=Brevibacterium samyangense TaxID=366888 RepID=A0ABP5EVF6_9MICO